MKKLLALLLLGTVACSSAKGFRVTEPENVPDCVESAKMEKKFNELPIKTRRGLYYPVPNTSVKTMVKHSRKCKQKLYADSKYNELHGKRNFCSRFCFAERWSGRAFWAGLLIALALL